MSSNRKRRVEGGGAASSSTAVIEADEGTYIVHGDADADSSEDGLLADELIAEPDDDDNVSLALRWRRWQTL